MQGIFFIHGTLQFFCYASLKRYIHVTLRPARPRFGYGRQRARKRGKGPQGAVQQGAVQQLQWQAVSDLAIVARAAMERGANTS